MRPGHLFEKCIDGLKRSGGSGAVAARRAETILSELTGHSRHPDPYRRLNKNGEARIKKCRKFDLGGGYRLICIKEGARLLPLYAGSHDDCDRWLHRNSGSAAAGEPAPLPGSAPLTLSAAEVIPANDEPSSDGYDDLIRQYLDERIIRELFKGLWER